MITSMECRERAVEWVIADQMAFSFTELREKPLSVPIGRVGLGAE
jgi:hypothetical protein